MASVRVSISKIDGSSTTTTVDLLEDYWFDFVIFRKEARVSFQNEDLLRTHRYIRSGIVAFLSYLKGLANRWQASLDHSQESPFPLPSLAVRLTRLADHFQTSAPPVEDVEYLTDLEARFSDLHPADEWEVFQALMFEPIDSAELRLVSWLDEFLKASGLTAHTDTRSLASPFKAVLGGDIKADYHEFDAIKDDPHAFQDPPGTWEEIDVKSESANEND
jgi:hypothetical protein